MGRASLYIAPSLVSCWIILSFYAANADKGLAFGIYPLYSLVLAAIVCAIVAAGSFALPLRAHNPLSIAVTFGVVVFFQYSTIETLMKGFGTSSITASIVVFGGIGFLVMVIGAMIGLSRQGVIAIWFALAAMIAAAFVQTGISLLGADDTRSTSDQAVEQASTSEEAQLTSVNKGQSVFYIVLDTYASADNLYKRFGYDMSDFERDLQQRGFTTPKHSFSNYPWTSLSMSSAAEQTYVQTEGEHQSYDSLKSARTISDDNFTLKTFRQKKYNYVMFNPGRYNTTLSCTGEVDHCLQCGGVMSEAEILLLQRTPLSQVLRRFLPGYYVKIYGQCPVSQLGREAADLPLRPMFLLAHHMALHDPLHVDANCSLLSTPYPHDWQKPGSQYAGWQLDCLNSQVIEAVDSLIEGFHDPIIVISGDHGIQTDGFANMDPVSLKMRFGIFTAMRLPDRCRSTIPELLTPINHYELIIACLEQREPNLKADRFFWTRFLQPGVSTSPIQVREFNLNEIEAFD